jgi:hypothetical protein
MPTKNKEDQIKHSNEKRVASPEKLELKPEIAGQALAIVDPSFKPIHPDEDQIKHSIDAKVPAYNWAPPKEAKLERRQVQRSDLFKGVEPEKNRRKFENPQMLGKLRMTDVKAFASPKKSFKHDHPGPHNSAALNKAVDILRTDFERVAGDLPVVNQAVGGNEAVVGNQDAKDKAAKAAAARARAIAKGIKKAFSKQENQEIEQAQKEANKQAQKGASIMQGQKEAAVPTVQDAQTFLRLELGFDVIVSKIYQLCRGINNAIADQDNDQYKKAKKEYVEYLRNLNIAKPDKNNPEEVNADDALGYGRALKWVFVDPVIEEVKGIHRITGVTIVGEWVGGTHTSSNGVPIPDPPH